MRAHALVRLCLTVALVIAAAPLVDAQSGWPTKQPARVETSPKPRKARKPAAASTADATPAPEKPARKVKSEAALIRSLTELVARQTTAIDALARRLEAAERHIEALSPAVATARADVPEPLSTPMSPDNDVTGPFGAFRSVDWALVIRRQAREDAVLASDAVQAIADSASQVRDLIDHVSTASAPRNPRVVLMVR